MEKVKLIQMSLAILATKTELVFAGVIGDNVGDHAGDVIATFGWRNADLLKATDANVRCAKKFWRNRCIRAQEQLRIGVRVIVGHGVAEHLIEVIHSDQHLIGHSWSEDRVKSDRVVVNVDGRFFEVVGQVGTGSRKCGTTAGGSGLGPLPTEPTR